MFCSLGRRLNVQPPRELLFAAAPRTHAVSPCAVARAAEVEAEKHGRASGAVWALGLRVRA